MGERKSPNIYAVSFIAFKGVSLQGCWEPDSIFFAENVTLMSTIRELHC